MTSALSKPCFLPRLVKGILIVGHSAVSASCTRQTITVLRWELLVSDAQDLQILSFTATDHLFLLIKPSLMIKLNPEQVFAMLLALEWEFSVSVVSQNASAFLVLLKVINAVTFFSARHTSVSSWELQLCNLYQWFSVQLILVSQHKSTQGKILPWPHSI